MQGNFGFPCGVAPGFDPKHIAAKGVYASFSAAGATFRDLLRSQPPATSNFTGGRIMAGIGPCVDNTANFKEATFTGYPTTAYTTYTKAVTLILTATGFNEGIIGDGASTGTGFYTAGLNLAMTSAGVFQVEHKGIGNFSSALTLLTNVPYFLACSYNAGIATGNANFVVVRLDTGQILQTTVNGFNAAVTAPTGTITIGNGSDVGKLFIGAVMASNNFMSPSQLSVWAADPFSFWYPQ
jgi:hypothetical protein